MHIFVVWCLDFYVKFHRRPLEFHTKFWTHTLQNIHFARCYKFDTLWYLAVRASDVLVSHMYCYINYEIFLKNFNFYFQVSDTCGWYHYASYRVEVKDDIFLTWFYPKLFICNGHRCCFTYLNEISPYFECYVFHRSNFLSFFSVLDAIGDRILYTNPCCTVMLHFCFI